MKQMTPEIRARVFALYIGQPIVTRLRGYNLEKKRTSTFKTGILKAVDLNMISGNAGILLDNETDPCNYVYYEPGTECQLDLRRIDQLTDEEAMRIASMVASNLGVIKRYKGAIEVSIGNDNLSEVLIHFNGSIQIVSRKTISSFEDSYHEIGGAAILKFFDYLRSIGIALPYLDWSVEDLEREGVFKFKTEER